MTKRRIPSIQMKSAQKMYEFVNVFSRGKHLTIKDVTQLGIGETLDVVIWDRNFEEYWIWDNAESGKNYDAEEFFKHNRNQITYKGNMEWDIHFSFVETIEHPVHLDTTGVETNWTWVAIGTDGKIHITKEILNKEEKIPSHWKPKHIHWSEFPEDTRVGWRGPMMLWKDLKDAPRVYYVSTTK